MSTSIEVLQRPAFRPARWVISAAVAAVLAAAAAGTAVAIHRGGGAVQPVGIERPAPVQVPAVTGTGPGLAWVGQNAPVIGTDGVTGTGPDLARLGTSEARAHSGFRGSNTPAAPS